MRWVCSRCCAASASLVPGAGGGDEQQQQIEDALFGGLFGAICDFVELFFADHVDRGLHEIAHHGLDVAANVADFGVLGSFDLDEGTPGQARQAAGKFGLADASQADQQYVAMWCWLLPGSVRIARALVDRIPEASYLYFGDTARLPYGLKSAATVAHYAVGAVRYLQDQGAELLVIACNTATALALDQIKAAAGVEVIGVVEPGADAAAAASRKRNVVVIGTDATISSHAYRRALEARNVAVREKACPLFVPLVEEGWVEHPVTEQVARFIWRKRFPREVLSARRARCGRAPSRLHPLSADQAAVETVAPAHVAIVDSAESTALDVARQLQVELPPSSTRTKNERSEIAELETLLATDSAEKFRKMGTRFLGLAVEDVVHVDFVEENPPQHFS